MELFILSEIENFNRVDFFKIIIIKYIFNKMKINNIVLEMFL